ncbi:MAG TPA: cell wall-binding protein [Desulfosporosinus sp.]|jgi:putative cell wall-binding protein|nr:cell wall-binding protein [Desulfosporosinus sp.]
MFKKKIFVGLLLCVLAVGALVSYYPDVQAQEVNSLPNRLAGQDRFQTAKVIGEEFNSGEATNVILASGIDFPDALSASTLSKKLNAPILLADVTRSGSAEALAYIQSHLAVGGTIYIVGGTAVIGADVETSLRVAGHNNIVRLAGNDRYDTDMAVVSAVNVPDGTPVFIASGENFPDALSISSFAGAKQYPTLLVGCNMLPDKTRAYLTNNKPSTVYIAGGTSVVSQSVEAQIKTASPNSAIKRLAGNDRYDTAGVVVREFASAPKTIYLANGLTFPDALAGSALAARTGDPILLVDHALTTLPPSIRAYLQQLREAGIRPNVRAVGGIVVVPEILIQQAEAVLDGKPPIVVIPPVNPLLKLGYTQEKYALVFGSVDNNMYQSASEAQANMVKILINVWQINARGEKCVAQCTLTVHKAVAGMVKTVFKEIFEGQDKFPISSVSGYSWRGDGTSEHNWGLAIDINPNENYMINSAGVIVAGSFWNPGNNPYSIPEKGDVVTTFNKYGFTWGGNAWKSSNDYMHFSYLGR